MRVALAVVTLAALGACDSSSPECRVGADCASGVCQGNGQCAPPADATTADTSSDDGAVDAADANTDAADANTPDASDTPDAPDTNDTPDTTPGVCTPVDDDRISADEVPLAPGLHATFAIAADVAVDTGGALVDGVRTWDLVGPYAGDSDARVDLLPVTGAWWAADFAGATYAAQLAQDQDYRGVFAVAPDGLSLLGVVSPDDGLFETELTYSPKVAVYRFPLALGDSWKTDTSVTGLTDGIGTLASESYASTVDGAGTLATPFGSFAVLRVRTTLVRTVGLLVTQTYQTAFVAPCFGTVALVVSDSEEDAQGVTQASEVRRLAP